MFPLGVEGLTLAFEHVATASSANLDADETATRHNLISVSAPAVARTPVRGLKSHE